MHKLDVRLASIAEAVKKSKVLADIGSDHGYLPLYLLKNDIIERAIITDLNEGPLKNAEEMARKYCLSDKCEFVRGNGLEPIENKETDVISICGMGGELITSMLRQELSVAKKATQIVLQPMNNKEMLQKWLISNGFLLNEIKLTEDGKHFYFIISCCYESQVSKRDDFDLEFPPELIFSRSPEMKHYLEYRLRVENTILESMAQMRESDEYKSREIKINAIKERLAKYEV